MKDLKRYKFTNKADRAISRIGWVLGARVVVNALDGNDTISGISTAKDGINNNGTINTGAGNDTISGTAAYSGSYYGINNNGTINTDAGDDTITGAGYVGIINNGRISTGDGDDTISSEDKSTTGIYNGGTIDTGAGNDTITGRGTSTGCWIYKSATINTGDGNDAISGTSATKGIVNDGTINTGDGNDTITGRGSDTGINNEGEIYTGAGNDTITGVGQFGYNFWLGGNRGIVNDGTINTGAGEDIVDALKGGFGSRIGGGVVYLGDDNDTLKGHGIGRFYGGTGTDKLLFGEGIYIISGSTVVLTDSTMEVFEFERIGGANGGLFTMRDGTFTVNAAGVGTFA